MFPSQNFNSADQFPRASNHISKYVSSLHLLALCSTDDENRIACKAEGLKHDVVPLTSPVFFFYPIIIGAWKNSIEEWTAEDWNEDVSAAGWIYQLIIYSLWSLCCFQKLNIEVTPYFKFIFRRVKISHPFCLLLQGGMSVLFLEMCERCM